MKKFTVVYRGEFQAEVKAENMEGAIKDFTSSKIKCVGELHNDFFEVFDVNGRNCISLRG